MSVVFEKPDHIVVSYEAKRDYVLFSWSNFYVTLEEIEQLHVAALDCAKKKGCFYYVADTSDVTNALPQDVVRWWGETWVPVLARYGLKAIVTVEPKAALAKFSTKRWQNHVVVQGITLVNVPSRTEAEKLILSMRAARS